MRWCVIAVWSFYACAQTPADLAARVAAAPAQADTILAGAPVNLDLVKAIRAEEGKAFRRGDFLPCVDLARVEVRLAQQLADRTQERMSLHNLATCLGSTSDYQASHDIFSQALRIAEDMQDRPGTVQERIGIAIALRHLGETSQAIAVGEKALATAEEISDKLAISRIRNTLGAIYDEMGRYAAAREQYEVALRLAEEAGAREGIAFLTNNIAAALLDSGEYDLALPYLERSLKMKEELGDRDAIAVTCNNLGQTLYRLGRLREAAVQLRRATELADAAGDKALVFEAQRSLADLERSQGQLTAALRDATASLEGARASALATHEERSLLTMAQVLLDTGRRADALDRAREALAVAARMDDLEVSSTASDIAGQAAEQLGRKSDARAFYEQSVAALEKQRRQAVGGESGRQRFLQDRLNPYYSLARLALADGKLAEAFNRIEMSRARALGDVLAVGRNSPSALMTPEERARSRQLRQTIAQLDDQPAKRSQLAGARREYEAFRETLYARHPELRLREGRVDPVSAVEVGRRLPPRTVVLDYAVTPHEIWCFALSREHALRFYRIPTSQSDLVALTTKFRDQLSARDLNVAPTARRLYDILIAPASRDVADAAVLVVLRDGPLWQIPFQALADPSGKYLLASHAIAYAPSATVLSRIGPAPKPPSDDVLLLSHGLPDGAREVESIAALYGPDHTAIYRDTAALESVFKRNAAKYSMIHIAAHGTFDNSGPLYSRISLARDAQDDGRLEAAELMDLNLKARLVILSACETGRGAISPGEGLIGLNWALFVAGVRATVSSEWQVNSEATRELMLAFHTRLRAGQPPAEALRQSSLELMSRREYAHPFYWAAFSVFGAAY